MAPEIRMAGTADLGPVATYLGTALGGTPDRYRRFLDTVWLPSKPSIGVILEEDGRIRGFIGLIWSERRHGRCCNLTSIAVDESHRRHTLKMFGMALAAKDVTYTCLSASDQVAKILDFFKFEHRASERIVVGPISNFGFSRGVQVVTDPGRLEAWLDHDQRRISRDHRSYHCGQLVIVDGARRCYAVTVRRGRDVRAFADVLYASDPELLMRHLPRVHLALFRTHRTVLLGIDRTWLSEAPRISFIYRKLRPVHVRSPRLSLAHVDALYSELVPMYG